MLTQNTVERRQNTTITAKYPILILNSIIQLEINDHNRYHFTYMK